MVLMLMLVGVLMVVVLVGVMPLVAIFPIRGWASTATVGVAD